MEQSEVTAAKVQAAQQIAEARSREKIAAAEAEAAKSIRASEKEFNKKLVELERKLENAVRDRQRLETELKTINEQGAAGGSASASELEAAREELAKAKGSFDESAAHIKSLRDQLEKAETSRAELEERCKALEAAEGAARLKEAEATAGMLRVTAERDEAAVGRGVAKVESLFSV